MAIQIRRRVVLVRVPAITSTRRITRFVESRRDWIADKLAEVEAAQGARHTYSDGEIHDYLGRRYPLKVVAVSSEAGRVKLDRGKFLVEAPLLVTIERQKRFIQENLRNWYYARAQVKIAQVVRQVAGRVGLEPKKIAIKDLKRSWGICRSNGNISFCWRLVLAPPDLIEYIVLHEICHLEQLNHSPAFYRLVERYQPDYKERAARFARWVAGLALDEPN